MPPWAAIPETGESGVSRDLETMTITFSDSQLAEGFSTRSMTITPTGARVATSLNPSCS